VSQTHLLRRNAVFYYHRRVPLPLVKELGKKVILFSLGTRDLKEAKRLRAAHDVQWDARFEAVSPGPAPISVGHPQPSEPGLLQLVQDFVERADSKARTLALADPPNSMAQKAEIRINAGMARDILQNIDDPRGAAWVQGTETKILSSSGVALPSSNSDIFAEIVRRGLLELQNRQLARLEDDFSHSYFDKTFNPQSEAPAATFGQVADQFIALTDEQAKANSTSILMLRNLKSPETYFQAAFRVQSPWSIKNPNGNNPNEEEILKPICFVFDFAPTRALRQLSEYGIGLSPNESNPENAVKELVSFLPVLAYDGANMTQIDLGGILDIAMAGTSATLLARKWASALLVNVDNDTLRRILDNPEAMAAVERIEGWCALGDNVIETIINKSEKVKNLKNKAKDKELTEKQKKQLIEEEKEYKSKRKLVQEKLIKFATRIPAFMYLTDFRENTLQDVITKLEPDMFLAVTGLTVKDFHLLVRLKVFNTEQMNQAVFAFRRYEDASLRYTGIESHQGLTHYGLYDTVVGRE
jgi:hypothetical protein